MAEYTHTRLIDCDRRALFVDNVVRRSIRGLLDEEEWRKAASTAMEYDNWITDFHDIDGFDERLAALEEET